MDLSKGLTTYTLSPEELKKYQNIKPPVKDGMVSIYGAKSYAGVNGERRHKRPWERIK